MPIITTAISKLSRSDLDCECVIMRGEGVGASIQQSSENERSRSSGGGGLLELLLVMVGKHSDVSHRYPPTSSIFSISEREVCHDQVPTPYSDAVSRMV